MELKVKVYAAGSLRSVLPVIFDCAGITAEIEFGPSGVLREKIVSGEKGDLFFTAGMNHALSLAEVGMSGDPIVFAYNELCLFGWRELFGKRSVLEIMRDSQLRLGTSTPVDDPGGDYAFSVFDKAERLQCGAAADLKKKALPLVGGRNSRIKEEDGSPVYVLFKESQVDLFLGYRTTAKYLMSCIEDLGTADLPEEMQTRAEYGVVVIGGSRTGTRALNLLMTDRSREILISYGFMC